MEFNKREEQIIKIADSWNDKLFIKQIMVAFIKYSAFAAVMVFVITVIFQNLVAINPFAFSLMICVLMVYDLKGREILFISIIRKLRKRIKELELKK